MVGTMDPNQYTGDDTGPPAWADRVAPVNREPLERWGEPLNVEAAREGWFPMVDRAKEGTITLIAMDRAGPGWVAVVPLSLIVEPLEELRAWGSTEARTKLGDVVRAAGSYDPGPRPQVITWHRTPVAAVVSVGYLQYRPIGDERLDLVELMHAGGRVVLDFYPGTEPINDPDGPEPGEEAGFVAVAYDQAGDKVGSGGGYTIAEALASVRPLQPPLPPDDPSYAWSTEAPF